ncbi:MAG: HTH domain-containing protein [Halanaerobium sp.]
MMKVSELADDLKVSRQTIYNHIDKLQPEIDNHIDKIKGAKVIDIEGIEMIRDSVNDKSQVDNKTDEEKAKLYHRQIELLEKQIEQLEDQVETKDQQIKRLHIMIQQSQKNVEQLTGEVEKKSLIDKIKQFFT